MAASKLRLGLIQLGVGLNKTDNLFRASKFIGEAVSNGAKIISLPECFNSPYGNNYFPTYAEEIPGETTQHLASLAKQYQIYLIGGSIPEVDNGKYYNSCAVFGPNGDIIAKYRKIHLFDIDIPGKITFMESETLSPGSKLEIIDTPYCKIGLGICFDLRFPEMALSYAKQGCKLLLYPGAFNMTTGPAHWELLSRARALDNQLYVASVSPARDEQASYVAWGHTLVVNPWGSVVGTLDHSEGVLYADLDFGYVDEIRKQIPLWSGKQLSLYQKP